jgi:hypothetical protein
MIKSRQTSFPKAAGNKQCLSAPAAALAADTSLRGDRGPQQHYELVSMMTFPIIWQVARNIMVTLVASSLLGAVCR